MTPWPLAADKRAGGPAAVEREVTGPKGGQAAFGISL